MQTALPAKLRTYCRSFLTSVSVCAVSHMLHSYLLGVTLIINVASYLPVTGYDSLLTVFSAAVHVSVSVLCVPGACANICVFHVWNSPLFLDACLCDRWVVTEPIRACTSSLSRSLLSRYTQCVMCYWCEYQPVKAAAYDVWFFFFELCRRMVCIFHCVRVAGSGFWTRLAVRCRGLEWVIRIEQLCATSPGGTLPTALPPFRQFTNG